MTAAFLSGPQGNNGWYTGPVTVALIATDIDGPSDIASTTNSVDGGSLTAYASPFVISADGVHTIQYGSVDLAGNVETPRPSQKISIDATAPSFVTSPPSLTVPPTSAAGAVVAYTLPTATDATSGVSPAGVSCAPASGSTFPLGTTTVSCMVADNAGNVTKGAFTVTVRYNFQWTIGKPAPTLNSAEVGDGYKFAFNLGGNFGLNVVTALTSTATACTGTRGSGLPEAEGHLGLSYNATTGNYQEAFRNPGRNAQGTCAQVNLKLNDGTTQAIDIKYVD